MVNNKKGEKMKTILITGGAGGIAKSVIDKIKNKYYIYIGVHNMKQLELVSNRYKKYKNIKVIKLDMMDSRDIKSIGSFDIDILFCNAAISYGGSITELNIEKIKEIFEVNVFKNIELIQIVLKNMIKKDSGKIIIMSSLISLMNVPFLGPYASSKASLNKIAQALKSEIKLISKNITVHLIEPGMYKTGFNEVMLENKYKFMNIDSYFKSQIDIIRKRENIFWGLLQRKKLNSITKQIIKCIKHKDKFIYKAPISQWLFAKIYSLIND